MEEEANFPGLLWFQECADLCEIGEVIENCETMVTLEPIGRIILFFV
jgi:hypothetical protein